MRDTEYRTLKYHGMRDTAGIVKKGFLSAKPVSLAPPLHAGFCCLTPMIIIFYFFINK